MTIKRTLLLLIAATFIGGTAMAQSLSTGLVAYYPFNGNFNDNSQYTNNATQHGGVTFATDKWGNANSCASFDGVDDWVDAPATVSNTLDKYMTMSFLYKPYSSLGQEIISKSNYSYPPTNNFQYQVGFNQQSVINVSGTNDHIFFSTNHYGCTSNGNLAQHYLFSDSLAKIASWSCVTVVFNLGEKKIYVDGQLIGIDTVTVGTSNTLNYCVGGSLRFGIWWQQHQMYFEGLLDEFRLYNRVLSLDEISQLCNYNPLDVETIQKETMTISNDITARKIYVTKISSIGNANLKIINQLGQEIYKSSFDQNRIEISTAQFTSGVYLVQLKTPTGISNQKLIIP